jgi:preprotein translocase subunit SecF
MTSSTLNTDYSLAGLYGQSLTTSETRLALVMGILVLLLIILGIFLLFKFFNWFAENRKGGEKEVAEKTIDRIESTVNVVRERSTEIKFQTDQIQVMREDLRNSLQTTLRAIDACTDAIRQQSAVTKSLVKRLQHRPCQLDPHSFQRLVGLKPEPEGADAPESNG